MLTYHKYGPVPITQGLYHNKYMSHQLLKCHWNALLQISFKSPRRQWFNHSNTPSRSDEAWKRYTIKAFGLTKMPHCDCWTDCTKIILTHFFLMMIVDNEKHATVVLPTAQNHISLTTTSTIPCKVCCVSLAHTQPTFPLLGQSQRGGCFDFMRVWQLAVSSRKCRDRFKKKFGGKTSLRAKIWDHMYCH